MANTIHYDEIRRMLAARRRELQNQVHSNLRDARTDASANARHRVESGETTEVHPEDDLAFALIQIKSQVLNRIDEAMRRLDEGTYGYCGECDEPISTARLRALPFAVRCKECEEMREFSEQRERARPEWRLS